MTVSSFGLILAGNVLSIDGSFLFIFFSIVLLIWILNHTLFKPINQILNERERLGTGRIGEARRMMAEYEERLKRYETQLREARGEAYQRLEAERRETALARQRMIADVKGETSAHIEGAKQEIAKQAAGAKQNLENEARAMAGAISSQILHRPVGAGGK
ncbi:MAG TPA: ATP synthase F0 subunit B [Blastocatellia bacterium]|nr:ATP synthase F0 subunit B [Blastocatellia bacterium]